MNKDSKNIESKLQDFNISNMKTKEDSKDLIESNNSNTIDSKHILEGKMKPVIKGANDLSLGISMVVAVLLGLGLGYLLYMWLGYYWLIWVGLGYGFAAAFLNVYKAYKRLHKELDSIKDDEKYKYMEEMNKSD